MSQSEDLRQRAEPPKADERFLRHAVASATSYTEGWRAVCERLLWVESRLAALTAVEQERDWQAAITKALLPYQERAVAAESRLAQAEARERQAFEAGFQWAVNGVDKYGEYLGGPVEDGYARYQAQTRPEGS